jgi:cytochrome c-type biogenesis protein CcmE
MKLWVRCAVFFAVTYPVLYAAHFHLALWQYFVLGLVASALAQGVWWLVRGSRRRAAVAGIVATLAGAASAAYALSSVGSSVVYLVEVDEVAARPGDFSGRRVRVHGYARPGSLVRTNGGLELDVVQHGHGLTVRYVGLAPDQLRDGMEIVAAGRLGPAGRFDADELLVKCPSNYDRSAGAKPS